jgi:hypothetical protein
LRPGSIQTRHIHANGYFVDINFNLFNCHALLSISPGVLLALFHRGLPTTAQW